MTDNAQRSRKQLVTIVAAFVLFTSYALLRWQTFLLPNERGRMLALLGLSIVMVTVAAGYARWLPNRQRRSVRIAVVVVAALLAVVVMLALAGLPLRWLTHLRFEALAKAIDHGLSALPAVNVPYRGHGRAIRAVIVLSAGLLLLLSVLALGRSLADGPRTRVRRSLGIAAAPLLFMTLLPSLIGQPRIAGLQGALTFVLVVAFICGWAVGARRLSAATGVLALCVAGGLLIAHVIHPRHGLITVTHLVSKLGPAGPSSFDWSQTYGPLGSQVGDRVVLRVAATRAAYWKTEDLDRFDGRTWLQRSPSLTQQISDPNSPLGVSRKNRRRWTQELTVTDVAMISPEAVVAGTADAPVSQRALRVPLPGAAPGTWMMLPALKPGSSYSVKAYTPQPTAAELTAAKTGYPETLARRDLTTALPLTARNGRLTMRTEGIANRFEMRAVQPTVRFTSYAQRRGIFARPAYQTSATNANFKHSVLWPVYELSERLARHTTSPYAYVAAVDSYLHNGDFTYIRNPPQRTNPIVAFLLHSHRGYCQQFAGAMALLLRMGGVPARVAVGFETGTYDRHSHSYAVTAQDAHAWVEAWFPSYGWVTFDPTPSATDVTASSTGASGSTLAGIHDHVAPGTAGAANKRVLGPEGGEQTNDLPSADDGGGIQPAIAVVLGICLVGVLLALIYTARWLVIRRRLGYGRGGGAVGELQAAFARCDRPLRDGVTLAQVEQFLVGRDAGAAAYVRSVRLSRFSPDASEPTPAERRALRAWLARGRGLRGQARALLALPPQFLHL